MDRHSAYVALSRQRDGVDLHFGRDDFADQGRLVRILSRERSKDMATDYERTDPAQAFAERRGISVRERVVEIMRKVPEKARGIFDGFRPKAAQPEQVRSNQPTPGAAGMRGAVERYARALDEIGRTRESGAGIMPHQRAAIERAGQALDAIRPDASTDAGAAFARSPELVREAAEGRGQAAMRAIQLEAEIRADPFQRADRFVEGWQQLQRQHQDLVRDGDFRGAKTTVQHMSDMAKSLQRDAQLESVLGLRSRDLGLELPERTGRSLSGALADSIPFTRDRSLGLSR
jgi:hypothetical protein